MKQPRTPSSIFSCIGLWPALACAGLLLAGAWIVLAGAQLAWTGRDANRQAAMTAQALAAGIDAGFGRFAEQIRAFQADDFTGTDRVAQTARLLRLQAFLPQAVLFQLSPAGDLLAASAPFARQDASRGSQAWFAQALAGPTGAIVPLPLDAPWLGVSDGIVLVRRVDDPAGKVAGLVGAVLPRSVIAGLLAPGWLSSGAAVSLTGADPGPLLDSAPTAPPHANRGSPVMVALLHAFGQPTVWADTTQLHTMVARVTVALPAQAVLAAGSPQGALLSAGGLLLAAWLMLCRLAIRGRRSRPAAVPGGFGADWQCRFDSAGAIIACHGRPPDGVQPGQPLTAALNLEPAEAERFAAAQQNRRALEDLQAVAGGRVWRLNLSPLPDGSFRCAARDVTAEAEAIAARDAARTALGEVQRNQDRLLTSLGHDIRTPMASIMGTCELLLDGELEEEQRAWLERVRGSCGALLGMLNGLLAVAEDATAPGALLCEPVDVGALVQEVVNLLRPQARDKGLELHTRCDDLLRGLWLVDPSRLRQVVFNLASNAVKYTSAGRVEIRASAAEADGHGVLRIAVSDTGPGIDPAEREEIFERFRRGRAYDGATQGGGLGLGLALCRENAAAMGGSITLESAVGIGSEFTFECPADRVQMQDRPLAFAGRTALVVADDVPATRALAAQLTELGLLVETAPDGYLGLALAERLEAQRGAVDLVVLQGNLPGMPGEAFVLRLRRTAFGRRAALVWIGTGAESAEVDAVAPAPPDPYEIAAVARQLLAQRPSLDALSPHVSLAGGGRLLLVDDDQANRTLLSASLTRRGFAVFTASSGQEALRLAGHDSFDAILMDLQMPGMDGFETTRRLRALPGRAAKLPIIALTALQGARLRQRCQQAGFTAVLEKPVNLERLTACLEERIGSTHSADATGVDYAGDVSMAYLEEMVAVVGLERARVCVAEFIADAIARCRRLSELLPGWEVEAIQRCCEAISGRAETCGAFALSELLEEIADAATRDDRQVVDGLVARLETLIDRLPGAMAASLDDIERRWRRDSKAA